MKNYTLDELLQTKKAKKIIDENLSSYNDEDYVYAVLEISYWKRENGKTVYNFDDLENAINDVERWNITIYKDMDAYYDSCDETLEFNWNSTLENYFDYDAFHRDCEYDVTEASNGVVIGNW